MTACTLMLLCKGPRPKSAPSAAVSVNLTAQAGPSSTSKINFFKVASAVFFDNFFSKARPRRILWMILIWASRNDHYTPVHLFQPIVRWPVGPINVILPVPVDIPISFCLLETFLPCWPWLFDPLACGVPISLLRRGMYTSHGRLDGSSRSAPSISTKIPMVKPPAFTWFFRHRCTQCRLRGTARLVGMLVFTQGFLWKWST